jgi:plasmid stabilization system protein ParE
VRVVFAKEAEADLEEIGDYIAKDNARRALAFVRELRGRAQDIGSMPRAFPLVPRYEHHAIRRRPFRDYLIFYRVEDDRVSILHILHGARDYETLLFPE